MYGLRAEGAGQQLVAEADPEDRHLARAARRWPRWRSGTVAGSPGPFDRKTPSGRRASTSAAGVDAGTTSTVAMPAELAQDRALDAEVVGDDAARAVADRVGLGASSPSATRSTPSVPGSAAAAAFSVDLVGGAERAGHGARPRGCGG